jgi:hypothetical protein
VRCLPNLCEIVWSREHEPRGVRARTEGEGSMLLLGQARPTPKFCVSLRLPCLTAREMGFCLGHEALTPRWRSPGPCPDRPPGCTQQQRNVGVEDAKATKGEGRGQQGLGSGNLWPQTHKQKQGVRFSKWHRHHQPPRPTPCPTSASLARNSPRIKHQGV